MTREDRIKVLAKLDGWTQIRDEVLGSGGPGRTPSPYGVPPGKNYRVICKSYLTSYDAIIPLIQKQDGEIRMLVCDYCLKTLGFGCYFDALPEQLADALIKAVGKWME